MVVDNFHIFRLSIAPDKTDAELIIDTYGTLTFPVCGKGFQSIARWYPEIIQQSCRINLIQFSNRHLQEFPRTDIPRFLAVVSFKNIFSSFVFKRPYHDVTVSRYSCYVKGPEKISAATCGISELLTCDRDYSRFGGLRTRNPLVDAR